MCFLWALVSSFTKLGKRYFCFGNCKVLLLLLLLFRSTNAGAREPAIRLSQRWWDKGMMKMEAMNYERKREWKLWKKRALLVLVLLGGNQEGSPWNGTTASSHTTGHLIQYKRNLFSISFVLSTQLWEIVCKEMINAPYFPDGSSKRLWRKYYHHPHFIHT